MPFKYVIAWGLIAMMSFFCRLVTIGHTWGQPVASWRRTLIFYCTAPIFRAVIFVIGIYWVDKKRVKVDYSKYLGPDWKPSFEGHGV